MIHDSIKQVRKKSITDFCYRRFVSVCKDTLIEEVLKKFNRLHSSILPVVDNEGKLVGKIRKSDLMKLFVDPKDIPEEHIAGACIDFGYIALRASEIMSKYGAVADEGMPVHKAALMMMKHHLTSMPVVDKNNKLVGILCGDSIIEEVLRITGNNPGCKKGNLCPVKGRGKE
ncbi:MAG: CBS domain-containing protein [Candidatus Diapherotrites archaeon]|nr:CBS domain-containing protein [Candidatus Diapherotrites archaeon]